MQLVGLMVVWRPNPPHRVKMQKCIIVNMSDYYRVTVNFPEQEQEWFDERMETGEYNSRSELVVDLFEQGRAEARELAECRERVDELEARIAEKEERIDELEDQLAKRSQIEEKIEALPDKISGERIRYSEVRDRALDQASTLQTIIWTRTGVPDEALDAAREDLASK